MIIFGQTAVRDFIHTLRLSLIHLGLITFVVFYMLFGAFVLHKIEGHEERKEKVLQKIAANQTAQELRIAANSFLKDVLSARSQRAKTLDSSMQNLLKIFFDAGQTEGSEMRGLKFYAIFHPSNNASQFEVSDSELSWAFGNAVLFTFSAITTIGYGNTAPATVPGRLICMVYSLLGIPLAMLAIADLGKFIIDGSHILFQYLKQYLPIKRDESKKKTSEPEESSGWKLLLVFFFYIIIGAAVIPLWEKLDFFRGVYYCFVTLTTIGLGDIFPENLMFLPLTLLYVSIGLALTTMSIEAAGNSFRKLHYFGAKLKNAKDSVVWFGGKNMTVEEILQAVGRKYGIPENEITGMDLDSVIGGAIVQREEDKLAVKREKQSEKKGLRAEKFKEQLAESARPLMAMARASHDFGEARPKYARRDEISIKSGSIHSFCPSSVTLSEAGLSFTDRECVNFAKTDRSIDDKLLLCEKVEEVRTEFAEAEDLLPDVLPILRTARAWEIPDIPVFQPEPLSLATALVETEPELQSAKFQEKHPHPIRLFSQSSTDRLNIPPTKRTLSQSLGLKVPTQSELDRLKSTVPLRKFSAATMAHKKQFFLVRISDLRDANFHVERCKQCLVAFPKVTQVAHMIGLLHWERSKRRGSLTRSTDQEKFRPVVIHPWYTCVSRRYPFFTVDLLKIDSTTVENIDFKQQQLLLQQLGIAHLDEIDVVRSYQWGKEPEPGFDSSAVLKLEF